MIANKTQAYSNMNKASIKTGNNIYKRSITIFLHHHGKVDKNTSKVGKYALTIDKKMNTY